MAKTFREKALEASWKKYRSEFKKGQEKFIDMGRVQPLSRKQFENFFSDKWGTTSEQGPIWRQVIGEFSSGTKNKAMERSYESYIRMRSSQEKKGFTFETSEPISRSDFYVEWHAMREAGVKNIAREQVYGERIFSTKIARRISKFVSEKASEAKKALEEASKAGMDLGEEEDYYISAIELAKTLRGKNLAKEDRPRGEMYREVASILGYQAAEEYVYPEQAAKKRRTIEAPIIFTRDENGNLIDPYGNIIGRI